MGRNARLLGAREMATMIRTEARRNPSRAAAALYREANIEMTEMKRRVPVLTGELRSTGTVHTPEQQGRKILITLTFGSPSVTYAVVVHENLEAFHKNGQAKYAESVLLESAPYMSQRLAARMKLGTPPETTVHGFA